MTDPTKQPDRDDKMSSEDYENLLDHYQFSNKEITMGTIIKGKVIKRTPTHILLDIGFKSEGAIPIEEFTDPKALAELRPGSEIEAMLEKTEAKDGYLLLSKKRADMVRAIDLLEKAYTHNTWITGTIVERTRGGFNVNVGILAFLPESHVDIKPVKDPASLIGQNFKFKVMKFDRRSENAVLSRKLLLQDEREKKKRRVFSHIAKGQKITGHVKTLTSFGAFVDLGGIEGLLHVSDMSWGKIGHPSEVLTVGQEVEVIVLDFSEKDEKISLGLKQLTPDPWANIAEKYQAEDHRQSLEPHGLRSLHRARKGRRRAHSHLRPDLVPEARPSQEGPRPRPGGRRHDPRGQPDDQAHFPGPQAGLPSPARGLQAEARDRRPCQGRRDEPDGLRRLC
jgi:small subunit ribosomal protein S1